MKRSNGMDFRSKVIIGVGAVSVLTASYWVYLFITHRRKSKRDQDSEEKESTDDPKVGSPTRTRLENVSLEEALQQLRSLTKRTRRSANKVRELITKEETNLLRAKRRGNVDFAAIHEDNIKRLHSKFIYDTQLSERLNGAVTKIESHMRAMKDLNEVKALLQRMMMTLDEEEEKSVLSSITDLERELEHVESLEPAKSTNTTTSASPSRHKTTAREGKFNEQAIAGDIISLRGTKSFLLPSGQVAYLFSHEREKLASIEAATDTEIRFDEFDPARRKCLISGCTLGIIEAEKQLRVLIREYPIDETLTIPREMVRYIKGKNGTTIKSLKADTGDLFELKVPC
ncbi:unnamed protein product [Notodromas monacha]|uniref:Uncharacterized protein n=1 Tax=Notodromas monacha TaxID=399045 RepID=A0A7R9G849_9CRUS|nr:unnamed protein product [Notodromas monacha]CAG0912907.1 unnamed protein product [Notodromas monacha]